MKHHRTEFSTYVLIVLLGASITFMKTCAKEAGTTFIDVRKLDNSFESIVVEGQGYFPVILGLPTNEVVVVLRGGAPHIGINGRLDIVRSKDSGVTWSAPQIVVDSDKDDRNPSMGRATDGTIVLAYHWQAGYDDSGKWSPDPYKQDTKIALSHDEGASWEEAKFLNLEIQRGNSPFGKMFQDADGTLYMPIYGAKNPKQGVRLAFDTTYTFLISSTDNGQTWGNVIEVARDFNEADVLILADGEWLCAARSQKRDEQAIYLCRSHDKGHSWSAPVRITDAKEHPPDMVKLSDGTIVLIFGVRHQPYSVQGMISRDNGHTWLNKRLLFADDLPGVDIGYPSTVRLTNGKLITVYYRAGSKADHRDGTNPACLAICYDEKVILDVLKSVD